MKNFLFVTGSDKSSGPNKQLLNLLISLSKNKNFIMNLYICNLVNNNDISILNDFKRINNLKIICKNGAKSNYFKRIIRNIKSLSYLIKNNNYDIIQSSGLIPDLCIYVIKIFIRLNFKWICFVRSQIKFEYKIRFKPLIWGKLLSYIHEILISKCDMLICVSDSVAKQIKKINTQKMIMHNSLTFSDEKKIRYLNIKKIQKQKYVTNDYYSFVYVGHLDYLKNPKEIVEFWLKKNSQNLNLKLIGRFQHTKYFNEIINNVNLSKNIKISDYRNKIISEYFKSDIYISASRTEGFPNTVIEALCCGCICILSDIPPHREIKKLFSNYIFLFKLGSYKSLDSIIEKACKKISKIPRSEIIEDSIKYFSSKNLEAKYLNILKNTFAS